MTAARVQIGEILAGKYRVERVLGEGGMGVVVAARISQLDQQSRSSSCRKTRPIARDAVARFLREARAAAAFRSEHVARVLDVGTLPTTARRTS